jgi:hypothetical protein
MLNRKTTRTGLMVLALLMMTVTPAFARTISMKDGGVALWIFIGIGAVIILLQLIPAAILFFSLIGTTSVAIFKGKKEEDGSPEVVPAYKTVPVKK